MTDLRIRFEGNENYCPSAVVIEGTLLAVRTQIQTGQNFGLPPAAYTIYSLLMAGF